MLAPLSVQILLMSHDSFGHRLLWLSQNSSQVRLLGNQYQPRWDKTEMSVVCEDYKLFIKTDSTYRPPTAHFQCGGGMVLSGQEYNSSLNFLRIYHLDARAYGNFSVFNIGLCVPGIVP